MSLEIINSPERVGCSSSEMVLSVIDYPRRKIASHRSRWLLGVTFFFDGILPFDVG
jgi:hypothetical protein